MAPWLPRSVVDSLRLDEDGSGGDHPCKRNYGDVRQELVQEDRIDVSMSEGNVEPDSWSSDDPEEAQARCVKEDFSELKQSLTRQLWGVANLLAPPPSNSSTPSGSRHSEDASDREDESDREGEATIGLGAGGFESGNDEEMAEEPVVGVKEVLNFARNIALHPETWLDFPLDPDEDLDDFEMSEAQWEHVVAIENLSPRLRALRIELCPCHMSESYFWKVYFVLLHSRLEKHDSEILSTPQVLEARALWMQELHKQSEVESDRLGGDIYHMRTGSDTLREEFPAGVPLKSSDFKTVKSSTLKDSDSENFPSVSSETQITGESAAEENSAIDAKGSDLPPFSFYKLRVQKFEDEEDDEWLDDNDSDLAGYNLGIITIGSDEDVSFSDLEDDVDIAMPTKS